MKLFVIGTGYVGLVSGACFSTLGLTVTCMDSDQSKIDLLNSGKIHIHEPGLEEIVVKHSKNGSLKFTSNLAELEDNDAIVIAVGTPSKPDGSADMTYVYAAAETIAKTAKTDKFIIIKSTVPIGTAEELSTKFKLINPTINFEIISNPEFLREGCAVQDFLEPDRIVIGYNSDTGRKFAERLYSPFLTKNAKIIFTSNINAELVKYAANSFLATKVAFINEIADLAERVGGDIEEIANGMGHDTRIGRSFLNAGPGYGGSCFPKDTKELVATAKKNNVDLSIVTAVVKSNDARKKSLIEKVVNAVGNLKGKTIAVLGLTFKADTDDMRDSASLDLIPALLARGATIKSYDPSQSEQAYLAFKDTISYEESVEDALKNANAVIILTEWSQFKLLSFSQIKELVKTPLIIDFRNIFSSIDAMQAGFKYYSIGRKVPELPEVQTVVNDLRQTMVGEKISLVKLSGKKLRVDFNASFKDDLTDAQITDIRRIAKYIVIDLNNGKSAIIHLGMSGKLLFKSKIVRSKHDHVYIKMYSGCKLVFNDPRRFGLFITCPTLEIKNLAIFQEQGVEPFDLDFTNAYLYELSRGKKLAIKSLIMNNRYLLGVGNIYASESLFRSGIQPLRSADSLSENECTALVKEIQQTLTEAINSGGSTLRDYTRSNGDIGYFQNNFFVYGRKDQPCIKCGHVIKMIRISGRSTFYCPNCQV